MVKVYTGISAGPNLSIPETIGIGVISHLQMMMRVGLDYLLGSGGINVEIKQGFMENSYILIPQLNAVFSF